MPERDLVRSWAAAHRITPAWLVACLGSWAAVAVFAAVTIPLKYPYDARGTVLDTGGVMGLLIPAAVLTMALDEGPRDLVAGASRPLWLPRLALAAAYVGCATAGAAASAFLVGLPRGTFVTDGVLTAGLFLVGVGWVGLRLGWLLPAVVLFVFTAPGLIPWEANLIYHNDTDLRLVVAALSSVALGAAVYARRGAVGLRRLDG